MNTHPIIFSTPMVRAIMTGNKTQTRRIVNPQPHGGIRSSVFSRSGVEDGHGKEIKKRYGSPGDILWVRETFARYPDGYVVYKADFPDDGFGSEIVHLRTGKVFPLVWKPSIHMPRRASRIGLEITSLRIERLNNISERDAIAEGCRAWKENGKVTDTAVNDFAHLWDEINLKRGYSWESNPFVWVITFQIIP